MKSEKKDAKWDMLLKNALKPVNEPDTQINERILTQMKEEYSMRKHKIPSVVLAVLCMLLFGSISAAAAIHFLTPSGVAENQGDMRLATVLGEENQLSKYESQTLGGYQITFMGLVSGENISDFSNMDNEKIISSETYAVIAMEKEDGTAISEDSTEWEKNFRKVFFIEGFNPSIYQIVNSCSTFCEDGVLYSIISSDNLEIFADRSVYLAVYEESSWVEEQDEYIYEEKTGKISRNRSCSRLNALFAVPLDASKADPEAAKTYFQELETETNSSVNEEQFSYELVTPEELYTEEGRNRLRERSELVSSVSCQVHTTEDGRSYVEYSYETVEWSCEGKQRAIEDNWEEFPAGTWLFMGYSEADGDNGLVGCAEILYKETDGSLTMNVFRVTDEK